MIHPCADLTRLSARFRLVICSLYSRAVASPLRALDQLRIRRAACLAQSSGPASPN